MLSTEVRYRLIECDTQLGAEIALVFDEKISLEEMKEKIQVICRDYGATIKGLTMENWMLQRVLSQ